MPMQLMCLPFVDFKTASSVSVQVMVRGKANDAVVTKMPFVPTAYYKAPTTAT